MIRIEHDNTMRRF